MPGSIFLNPGTVKTLTTSGSLLTTGSVVASANTFDNTAGFPAGQCFYANFELSLAAFGTGPAIGSSIELYMVPALDGSNFGAFDTSTPTAQLSCFAGQFAIVFGDNSHAQRLMIFGFPLVPSLYQPYIFNKCGQSLATAWALKIYPYGEQYN